MTSSSCHQLCALPGEGSLLTTSQGAPRISEKFALRGPFKLGEALLLLHGFIPHSEGLHRVNVGQTMCPPVCGTDNEDLRHVPGELLPELSHL